MRALLTLTMIAGLTVLLPPAPAGGQQQASQKQMPACAEGKFRDFDFWLGTWDVFGSIDGQLQGTNRIERVENGCLIKEHWTNTQGATGFSINHYDPLTNKWRQVWISGGGYSIDYAGGLNEAGQMVLEGDIHYYARSASMPFRGTWTANADGSVRQFFEEYDAESETWKTWFDGTYVRKEE